MPDKTQNKITKSI